MDDRLEGKWWTRGELGEVVLSNIEYYLIGQWDYLGFSRWATDFGIPHSEILMIIAHEQVLREGVANIELADITNKGEAPWI